MVSKKISAVLMLIFLVGLLGMSLIRAQLLGISFQMEGAGLENLISSTESFLGEAVPLSRTLRRMRVNLRYALGTREQDNVFIGEHRLIENISPPVGRYVQDNTQAIIEFAEDQKVPTYIMLIPTASAVLQSETPEYADDSIYNQKQFIEERYKNFAGKLSCVDVYSTLRQNSDKYIYFNTETLLTPQGGFLVYDVLTRRMGNVPYSLDRFNIEYLSDSYYGSLYDRVEFRNVNPDVISIYSYAGTTKEFTVRQHGLDRTREYNTLHPRFMLDLGRPLDVYLGGLSPVVEITQKKRSSDSLLIYGDRQMLTILPFLACDYQYIRFVDLSSATPQQLADIDTGEYNEILFAYSVDTFMHTDAPGRIEQQQKDGKEK